MDLNRKVKTAKYGCLSFKYLPICAMTLVILSLMEDKANPTIPTILRRSTLFRAMKDFLIVGYIYKTIGLCIMSRMGLIRKLSLAFGILIPLTLIYFEKCSVGPLEFLRNGSYVTYDYSYYYKLDQAMIIGISTILVGGFFFTNHSKKKSFWVNIVYSSLYVIGVEISIFLVIFAMHFLKCFTF